MNPAAFNIAPSPTCSAATCTAVRPSRLLRLEGQCSFSSRRTASILFHAAAQYRGVQPSRSVTASSKGRAAGAESFSVWKQARPHDKNASVRAASRNCQLIDWPAAPAPTLRAAAQPHKRADGAEVPFPGRHMERSRPHSVLHHHLAAQADQRLYRRHLQATNSGGV